MHLEKNYFSKNVKKAYWDQLSVQKGRFRNWTSPRMMRMMNVSLKDHSFCIWFSLDSMTQLPPLFPFYRNRDRRAAQGRASLPSAMDRQLVNAFLSLLYYRSFIKYQRIFFLSFLSTSPILFPPLTIGCSPIEWCLLSSFMPWLKGELRVLCPIGKRREISVRK